MVEWLRLETPLVSNQAILAAWEQTLSRALRQPAFRGHAARQAELRCTTERGGHWERTVTFKEALADLRRMWAALRSALEGAQFPGPLSELAVELKGLTHASGQQLALPDARSAMRERLDHLLYVNPHAVGTLHDDVRCIEAQAAIQVVSVVGVDRRLDHIARLHGVLPFLLAAARPVGIPQAASWRRES